jgi:hypothetical protein
MAGICIDQPFEAIARARAVGEDAAGTHMRRYQAASLAASGSLALPCTA